ncbi:hypothetical protein T261_08928 [Streptomyces lydicus]|nr:hypothetical protein T261_08928 [Streptomyces lydicus]
MLADGATLAEIMPGVTINGQDIGAWLHAQRAGCEQLSEGHVKVSRAHVENVVVDDQEHAVKLGVFLSNTKSRRGKLSADKLQRLAELGLDWAA